MFLASFGAAHHAFVGGVSVTIVLVVGIIFGALCGCYENWLTRTVMRLMDFMIGFPRMLLPSSS